MVGVLPYEMSFVAKARKETSSRFCMGSSRDQSMLTGVTSTINQNCKGVAKIPLLIARGLGMARLCV
jgi:hypothetical protein